jgi:hypothetical protein
MNKAEALTEAVSWRRRALAGGFLALIIPLAACTDSGAVPDKSNLPAYGPAAVVGNYASSDGRYWSVACIHQGRYVPVGDLSVQEAAQANLPAVRLSSELDQTIAEPVPEDVVVQAMVAISVQAGQRDMIVVPLLCTGQPQTNS